MKRRYQNTLMPQGAEMKSVDLGISQLFTTTGSLHACPIPEEGASFYNRIGRRVRGVSMQIRGVIHAGLANAAQQAFPLLRWMLVYDRQPNGALPSAADVLTNYDHDGSTHTGILAGINMNNKDRFVVLRDKMINTQTVGASGDAVVDPVFTPTVFSQDLVINEFVKLGGLQTHFKASTGAIGDVSTGSYFILLITGNGSDVWNYDVQVRFRFYD